MGVLKVKVESGKPKARGFLVVTPLSVFGFSLCFSIVLVGVA